MAENKINFNYGNEQLIKDAGSLSMFTALGTKDDVDVVESEGVPLALKRSKVSGICRIDYEFVPGISKDGASAINLASKKLYTFVRHVNSGSRNYDSPDLMMYVYSVISTYAFIAACERVYGVIKTYSCKNRYYGKSLVEAMGFDYDDLSKNLNDFRAYLNLAIGRLNVLKVPSYWTVWTKQWYLNIGLFKDGDVDKSQIYFYRMGHIWKYNETGTYVGSLTPVDVYATQINLSVLQSLIDGNINALVASEDINIMSGDILKAYGDNVINMNYLSEEFTVLPEYNRDILELIHNTNVYALNYSYTASSGFIIRQDSTTNAILFAPNLVTTDLFGTEAFQEKDFYGFNQTHDYLNFFRDDVQPGDVVKASAMTVLADIDIDATTATLNDCGTELATRCNFISLPNTGSTLLFDVTQRFIVADVIGQASPTINAALRDATDVFARFTSYFKFDWAPKTTLCTPGYSKEAGDEVIPAIIELFDLYNFTVISKSDLVKLHNLHVFAGFGLAD